MGVFLLTSEDSKEEIKEAFRKHLEFLMDDLCSVTSSYKIEKEEMDWLTEKSEIFLEKIDIKLIYWENLIALIENYKARRDINDFYRLCKRHKLFRRYKL